MVDDSGSGFQSLLSPGRIGALEIRNRIVMSPMGSNLCRPDGHLGERILRYYEERARGGVGLITVGVGAIAFPVGTCNPNQVGISDDAFLPGLRELTRRVHAHGAKAAIQLQHAGKVAVRDIVAGRPLWVPSILPYRAGDLTADLTPEEIQSFTADFRREGAKMAFHEMTPDDVGVLVDRFAGAALRARRAGFDGVELHAGHGYILSAFLSPASNKREDEYGGSVEKRARFLVEAIRAVKRQCGDDFPVWCRLDGVELRTPGGISEDDAQRTAQLAADAGADAIHVSAYADSTIGAAFTEAPLVHRRCGYVALAEAIKKRVQIPVIAVGRIEPEEADALIARGGADFVAMARKLLADPALPRKLAEHRAEDVRPCIYCYTCVGRIFLNRTSACAVNPTSGREFEVEVRTAERPRRVLIVGGGPAGMEAARIAAQRGHRVTLCERAGELGGALRLSTVVNNENGRLIRWQEAQLRRHGVDVQLDTALDAAGVEALAPDVALIAVGARRERPAVPGAERSNVWQVEDLVDERGDPREPGERLVVWGGGVGLSIANHWNAQGREVTVLEPGPTFGTQLSPPLRWRVLAQLREGGATLVKNARILSIAEGRVCYSQRGEEGEVGEQRDAPADTVVLAAGWQPNPSLANELAAHDLEVHAIGDCDVIGYVEGAFAAAARVAGAL